MHEVVTLQLGQQANYIGTHFWNTQESYFTYGVDEKESLVDHDIHFRQGRAADGSDTYTPRAVIYDFKRNFGTLRTLNELYNVVEATGGDYAAQSLWNGSTSHQRDPLIVPSQYQQDLTAGLQPSPLTSDRVRFWSDYNRVFLSPKSVVQVFDTELNPGQTAFEDWTSGEELFRSLDREEGLFEQDLRGFVEECDQMQGIQLFTSGDDGWSGFSAKYLEQIRDEMGKLPIWVWSSARDTRGTTSVIAARRAVLQAKSLVESALHASLYVPINSIPRQIPSWLKVESNSPWSTAALQLAALETATLPNRLRATPESGRALCATMDRMNMELNRYGNRNIVSLVCLASGSCDDSETLIDGHGTKPGADNRIALNGHSPKSNNMLCDLLPSEGERGTPSEEKRVYSEVICNRGKGTLSEANDATGYRELQSSRYVTDLGFPLLSSFPELFSCQDNMPARSGSVCIQTKLETSTRIGTWTKALASSTSRLLTSDERENTINALAEITEAYQEGHGSEDDWD